MANSCAIPYRECMTIRLTPSQQSIVDQAVKDGKAQSAEEFITVALRQLQQDLEPNLEERFGLSTADLNRELDKGLDGSASLWEGATSFHRKMTVKYQDLLGR